jgi:hypothetical protein
MFLIGLVSNVADQRGLLRPDAAPGDLYLGVRRTLASSPRLGSSRRVSGDVISDESAGGATHQSTCLTGGRRGCGNREIPTDGELRRTGVASPLDRSIVPHARTAAAMTAWLVLVCFMEASMVRV